MASIRRMLSPTRPCSSLRAGALMGSGRGRQAHSVEDLRVAGAAAEVAGEGLADLVLARVGMPLEKRGCRDDEPGSAEAALDSARLDESLLHPVQAPLLAEALDGHDFVPVRLGGEDEARAHELPVQEDGARPALALLAGVLRARQAELLAQREEQALPRPDVGLHRLAVDDDLDPHVSTRSSARAVRT